MERNMKTIEKIINIQTGEETIVENELSNEEVAYIKAFQLAEKQKADERAEKESARQAVLAKLGLTAEEAQALLG
jgi:hypothetical protein